MALTESIFDIIYLVLVAAMGMRLLCLTDKGAKLFGAMAVVLGSGDAFHLIPRVMAHVSEDGFTVFAAALSWGKMVTSITMTVFYLLFYIYYKSRTAKKSVLVDVLVYGLTVIRIVLTILPQNRWGSPAGDGTMDLVRNVPFAVLGVLLIVLCFRAQGDKQLKVMGVLIFFSFLFYIPVVLFAAEYPWVGALMMPKTAAYLLLVFAGYRLYIREFKGIYILHQAYVLLILGLAGGVFYREFTKAFGFTGVTRLGWVHVHILVLGFVCLLILYLYVRNNPGGGAALRFPLRVWMGGLLVTVSMIWIHGIQDVVSHGYRAFSESAFSGIAGLGHVLLGAGILWTMLALIKGESGADRRESERDAEKSTKKHKWNEMEKNRLLLLAGVVWTAAGAMVVSIGLPLLLSHPGRDLILLGGLSAATFFVFYLLVFNRIVNKHVARIKADPRAHMPFYLFFDVPSYLTMAVMMSGGILLRTLRLVPETFIAFFYFGLGTALFFCGIQFIGKFLCKAAASKPTFQKETECVRQV